MSATIDANTVTLRLTDGADGDADLTANGSIVDPVAVLVPVPNVGGGMAGVTAVPTLSEWGLMLLGFEQHATRPIQTN